MPYLISDKQSDCAGWATVKEEADGTYTTIGCHQNKQDAIDQMVAISIAEEMEPGGEVNNRAVDLSPPAFIQANATTTQQTTQTAAITGSPYFVNPTVITRPQINKAEALALTQWGGMKIQATSRIDFSVLNDDAELLLLI